MHFPLLSLFSRRFQVIGPHVTVALMVSHFAARERKKKRERERTSWNIPYLLRHIALGQIYIFHLGRKRAVTSGTVLIKNFPRLRLVRLRLGF